MGSSSRGSCSAWPRACTHSRCQGLGTLVCLVLLTWLRAGVGAVHVHSGLELRDALASRDPHVVINDHIDLSSLAPEDTIRGPFLLAVDSVLKTIQGNCGQLPADVDAAQPHLRRLAARTCLLSARGSVLSVASSTPGGYVWLARLYVRLLPPLTDAAIVAIDVFGPATVYMEAVTVQGTSHLARVTSTHWLRPLVISHSVRMHLQDCSLVDVAGWAVLGVSLHSNCTLSVSNCLLDNLRDGATTPARGVLVMHGGHGREAVRVHASNFTRVDGHDIAALRPGAAAYVDAGDAVDVDSGVDVYTAAMAEDGLFASQSDAALAAIKQDASAIWLPLDAAVPPGPPPPAKSTASPPSNSSLPPFAAQLPVRQLEEVAVIVAAVATACTAVGCLLCCRHRRRHRAQPHVQTAAPNTSHAKSFAVWDGHGAAKASFGDAGRTTAPLHMVAAVQSVPQGQEGPETEAPDTLLVTSSVQSASPTVADGLGGRMAAPLGAGRGESSTSVQLSSLPPAGYGRNSRAPAAPTPGAAARNFNHMGIALQLDQLQARDELLFGRFRLAAGGACARRRGGQALVAFVEDAETAAPLAAKFFMRGAEFVQERRLYGVAALRAVMPTLVFTSEACWTPAEGEGESGPVEGHGAPALPQCLVMERGESLLDYVRSAGHNLFSTMQALGHALQKLQDLHKAGWVHRDLKPGNLLWIPNRHSWALLDFGCAAQSGAQARLAYSLPYAAPEVLNAEESGDRVMTVQPTIDMWAFGVIAFEMLTEEPLFPRFAIRPDIVSAIVGRTPLPWEDARTRSPLLKKLGMFRKSVLLCLRRDPTQRIGCAELAEMWNDMFSEQSCSVAVC